MAPRIRWHFDPTPSDCKDDTWDTWRLKLSAPSSNTVPTLNMTCSCLTRGGTKLYAPNYSNSCIFVFTKELQRKFQPVMLPLAN